jgi:DNA-binding FadR family transcriptional regulator
MADGMPNGPLALPGKRVAEDLAKIRRFIQAGQFSDQDRLPPERELANTLGLSRSRLRTGLRKLELDGIVWRHVGRGTFCGRRNALPGINIPPGALANLTSPREVMEARLTVEPTLARLAAYRAKAADFAEMENCLDTMSGLSNWDDWEFWDCRLHQAIARAAGNTLLLMIYETLQANRNKDLWGRLREPIEPSVAIQSATQEHRAIVNAICQREPDASEAAMRAHLRTVSARIFGEI